MLRRLGGNLGHMSPGCRLTKVTKGKRSTCRVVAIVRPGLIVVSVKLPQVGKLGLLEGLHARKHRFHIVVVAGSRSFRRTGRTVSLKISKCLMRPFRPVRLGGTLDHVRRGVEGRC